MKKYIRLFFTLFVIFILFIPLVSSYKNQLNLLEYRNIIYVNGNNTQGPWEGTIEAPYQYIKDAIENSIDGDTIFVYGGIYFENLIINKSLSIIGENKNSTVIDGFYKQYILSLYQDSTRISNFTFINSGGFNDNAGVIINSEFNQISNCIMSRLKSGIIINSKSNNIINNCIFHTSGDGIFVKSSNNNNISNCYFTHNSLGINIAHSKDITIRDCYAETNGIGIFLDNSSIIEIKKCALFNNNDNQGGIFLNNSINIQIDNCNIYHNGFGIKLDDSSKINIKNSSLFVNTHFAFHLDENCDEIIIENNEIYDNLRMGLYIRDSKCILRNNNLFGSLMGVFSEHGMCDARNNWWGSFFGPALIEREKNDRIYMKFGIIRFFPWFIRSVNNAGSTWIIDQDLYHIDINNSRYRRINLSGEDSDVDGAPDWWEKKWGYNPYLYNDHKNLDPDQDALNNLEECFTDYFGSNPFKKDIFLEIDWIESKNSNISINKPSQTFIEKIIDKFKENNISFHVDVGNLGCGEEIPYKSNFSFSDLRDLYWKYFLGNDLNNPRKGIFHYCLVCDYGPGPGFAFIGWDHLDSFLISAQMIKDRNPYFNRDRIIIGGSMHELGHTLGLNVDDFGGNDNTIATLIFNKQWWKYQNYRSCMNYRYTYKILDYSNGENGKGDFDDWDNFDFQFFKNTHFVYPG
jgi:parallel beta-helix repeat protein